MRVKWLITVALVMSAGCRQGDAPQVSPPENEFAAMRAATIQYVRSRARREALLTLIDRLEQDVTVARQQLSSHLDRLRRQIADYDSSRTALEQTLSEFKAEQAMIRQRILDVHFEMREKTRPEEWVKIVRFEREILEPVTRISQRILPQDGLTD